VEVEVRRWVRLSAIAAAVCGLSLAIASCADDDGEAGQDPNQRLVEIYSATVTAIVDDAGMKPTAEDDPTATVFLQTHDDVEINADVQVGVVNELADWANVRFIDDIEEAIDSDADGAPVRDDGTLVGLGPVSEGLVTADLTADRYLSERETVIYEVSVERSGGVWTIEEPIAGVRVPNP
jgi:hypothetical protein